MNNLTNDNSLNFNKTMCFSKEGNRNFNDSNKINYYEDKMDLNSFINPNINNSSQKAKKCLTFRDKINKNNRNRFLNSSYISIDSKNCFTKMNSDFFAEKIKKKFNQNNESLEKLNKLSNLLKENFIEYLFPKNENNFFKICLEISKYMKKKELLKKEYLENYIEYFFKKRVYYKYAVNITINKTFVSYCGPILCHIFKSLEKYKIKDNESLIKAINEIKDKKIEILNDFFIYCNVNKVEMENIKKYKFLKNVRKNYILPPELIFFINIFHLVTKVSIDFDFDGEILTNIEVKLVIIVILGIKYLVKDFKAIKLNLMNRNFLYCVYEIYKLKLLSNEAKANIFFKSNSILFRKFIYDEKWDFENNFVLEFYKLLRKEKNFYYQNSRPNLNGRLKNVYHKDSLNIKNIYLKISRKSINKDKNVDLEELNEDEDSLKRRKTVSYLKREILRITNDMKKQETEYYHELVNKCSNILEIIFISFFVLNNIENLEKIELIINESYYYESLSYFRNVCGIDIGKSQILDLIYNKLIKMKALHFEINSFDLISFNRILRIINNNHILSDLQFSFFSSDCTCFPKAIRKISYQNIESKLMKINAKQKYLDFKIEDIFFKNIFPYFERNLNYFFEILQNKKLKILGINFYIPPSILNDEKFIIIIFKFILNIILLSIDNKKSNIEELAILSPNLVINGHKYIIFDEFLLNIHRNNKYLQNLSLQIKLYNIINIHKLVTNNLKIIKIGELDLFSFNNLVENITKYNFCKNCNLEEISISLNKIIMKIDNEIKIIIAKLFNIYMKSLKSINLYTNFIITIKEFKDIINLLENNWIPSYRIIFNNQSNEIIKDNKQLLNKIEYIMRIIYEKHYNENKNDKKKINSDIIDDIVMYLKILFNKRFGKSMDFLMKKKIISKILRYICISKETIIQFNLDVDSKPQL